jgi:hypothetical protein
MAVRPHVHLDKPSHQRETEAAVWVMIIIVFAVAIFATISLWLKVGI